GRFRVYSTNASAHSHFLASRANKLECDAVKFQPSIVDKIIHEAKKARNEGKQFKFDYHKYLPDYDNPFQLKKDEEPPREERNEVEEDFRNKPWKRSPRVNARYRSKHPYRYYFRHNYDRVKKETTKETRVNLRDYLICDSWPLDKEDKSASPNKIKILKGLMENKIQESNKKEKLKPVMDSFEFEIDPLDGAIEYDDCDVENISKSPTENISLYNPDTDLKLFDQDEDMSKEELIDANDDNFLESVINEIRQEQMNDDTSQDKGLVEYDMSPKDDDDDSKLDTSLGSVTPELDDRMRDLQSSQQSHYSDGYRSADSFKSVESGYKSTESGYKSTGSYKSSDMYVDRSTESFKLLETVEYRSTKMHKTNESYKLDRDYKSKDSSHRSYRHQGTYRASTEKEIEEPRRQEMPKTTVQSLETWSFVLKICQPLLFRHDKGKCFKETTTMPKVWYASNTKSCKCVKDRSVVYEELEMCKMALVDRVYGCDQISDSPNMAARGWYPRNWEEVETARAPQPATDWETDDPPARSTTPRPDEISLDHEYQRFMQAVWPEVVGEPPKSNTPRITTPIIQESRKQKKDLDLADDKKKSKKIKLSSEGWSQESDIEEEVPKTKKNKADKDKSRKRKHSVSTDESDVEEVTSKKKKTKKKVRFQFLYRRRSSSLSSDSSSTSSDSESEEDRKKKKNKRKELAAKKKKDKKNRQELSDSTHSDELFDENVLNNIKTERLTDDEKNQQMIDFSPRIQKPREREIINVKELQNDFVGKNILVKQEKVETLSTDPQDTGITVPNEVVRNTTEFDISEDAEIKDSPDIKSNQMSQEIPLPIDLKPESPLEHTSCIETPKQEDSSDSRNGFESQIISEPHMIPIPESLEEKIVDEKPKIEQEESSVEALTGSYVNTSANQNTFYDKADIEVEDKFHETYSHDNYEMYEHMAMAYQSDVAKQSTWSEGAQERESAASAEAKSSVQRIETVVRRRGEIKCDWRAGESGSPATPHHSRPSRWGLKPGEVNIVLTGGSEHTMRVDVATDVTTNVTTSAITTSSVNANVPAIATTNTGLATNVTSEQFPIRSVVDPVYQIETVASRNDNNTTIGYDEAYMDTYGAADRLQYGDCFAVEPIVSPHADSLEARIDRALRESALGDVANDPDDKEVDKDSPEKGILVSKAPVSEVARPSKRVSFADGYKPGQDSDVEEPPTKKRKKSRRYGCAWPCPATHPDHVPLWDALPPPPPPPDPPNTHCPHRCPQTAIATSHTSGHAKYHAESIAKPDAESNANRDAESNAKPYAKSYAQHPSTEYSVPNSTNTHDAAAHDAATAT
ncbi:hypothetical protein ACJJTC_007534, partial [Scirpophaga incertulas]